jgi:hypothetical protein
LNLHQEGVPTFPNITLKLCTFADFGSRGEGGFDCIAYCSFVQIGTFFQPKVLFV